MGVIPGITVGCHSRNPVIQARPFLLSHSNDLSAHSAERACTGHYGHADHCSYLLLQAQRAYSSREVCKFNPESLDFKSCLNDTRIFAGCFTTWVSSWHFLRSLWTAYRTRRPLSPDRRASRLQHFSSTGTMLRLHLPGTTSRTLWIWRSSIAEAAPSGCTTAVIGIEGPDRPVQGGQEGFFSFWRAWRVALSVEFEY